MSQVVSFGIALIAVVFLVSRGSFGISINNDKKSVNSSDIITRCNQTYQIKMEFLEELNETGSFSDETEKQPMCFMKCYLEKMKIMNENGEINKEVATAMYQIDNEETIDDCNNEMASASITDSCGKAYFFVRCVMSAALLDNKSDSNEDDV